MNGLVLCGEPGSGKTTIAREWAILHNGTIRGFADALKEQLSRGLSMFDSVAPHYHRMRMADPAQKDAYRGLLQGLGSFRRAQDDRYWILALATAMEPSLRNGTPIVVDDCRYTNEAEWLRSLGFKFVKLHPGGTTRTLNVEQAAHESERDWPHFEFDLYLTYEAGPGNQARRIKGYLG